MTDYRYTLIREVSDDRGCLCWVMLNPSTADDEKDDATIRRVKRFTRDYGYGSLVVVNLFAARATDPDELLVIEDLQGPGNARALRLEMRRSTDVVFAWGAWFATNRHRRVQNGVKLERPNVEAIARKFGHEPLCLGWTANGEPAHPLRLAADMRLRPYVR